MMEQYYLIKISENRIKELCWMTAKEAKDENEFFITAKIDKKYIRCSTYERKLLTTKEKTK